MAEKYHIGGTYHFIDSAPYKGRVEILGIDGKWVTCRTLEGWSATRREGTVFNFMFNSLTDEWLVSDGDDTVERCIEFTFEEFMSS